MSAMRRPSPRTALTLLFVVLGIAWGGFLGARHLAAVGSGLDQLESLSLDWRYSLVGPRIPPAGVVIAAIDEDTIRQAGAFPLPRNVLAQIVRGLARYNPQVICVDMLLLDPGKPDTDQELADALRVSRSVIGAAPCSIPPIPPANPRVESRRGRAAMISFRRPRASCGRKMFFARRRSPAFRMSRQIAPACPVMSPCCSSLAA